MARLHTDLQRTQRQAFAQGTVKNYKCQLKKFLVFAELSNMPELPISSSNLCLYIQYLSRSLKAPQSILNYVSGLKFFHSLLGLAFPSTTSIDVSLTIKGLKRVASHVPVQASPMTPSILCQLGNVLDMSKPLHIVVWCLFLFLFFLFSRKSQFIPEDLSRLQLSRLVTRGDVSCKDGTLFVSFRWTKTRQFGGESLVIPLSPIPGSFLCPVRAYNTMCSLIPAGSESPVFVLPLSMGSSPILYKDFHTVLRCLLTKRGHEASLFSSHSFRRGGDTFAFGLGIRGELIQAQGDWRSDAYKLYLNLDMPNRLSVSRAMASQLVGIR